MRNWFVFLFLLLLVLIPFLIWGEFFTEFFSDEKTIRKLESVGTWAWLLGLVLLVGDLFLPLPGTIIMSALGYIYGPLAGGLIASLGGVLSGSVAYWLCRALGERIARKILGPKDYTRGHELFAKRGGWIVAFSRWLPMLPEAIACMAGLNRMPWKPFLIALVCGSIPLGFVFAYIGDTGNQYPVIALILSALLPLVLWIISSRLILRQTKSWK